MVWVNNRLAGKGEHRHMHLTCRVMQRTMLAAAQQHNRPLAPADPAYMQ